MPRERSASAVGRATQHRHAEPEKTLDEAKTTNVQMAFDGVPASSWLSTAPKLLALAALPAAAGAIFVVALYSL